MVHVGQNSRDEQYKFHIQIYKSVFDWDIKSVLSDYR